LAWSDFGPYIPKAPPFDTSGDLWDPLNDDGDALRLAVVLHIFTTHYDRFIELLAEEVRTGIGYLAATRRAIVRVAAEIGKEME
jgi:hypothetical protein